MPILGDFFFGAYSFIWWGKLRVSVGHFKTWQSPYPFSSIYILLLSRLPVFLTLVEVLECSMGRRYVELLSMYQFAASTSQVKLSSQESSTIQVVSHNPITSTTRSEIPNLPFWISHIFGRTPKSKSDAAKSRPESSWYHNILKEKTISNCQTPSPPPLPR